MNIKINPPKDKTVFEKNLLSILSNKNPKNIRKKYKDFTKGG